MRRRLLLATIMAVAVAVVLLGVPLALFGAGWVRQGEDQRIHERLDGLTASVQMAQDAGLDVPDDALIQAATGTFGDPRAFVTVSLPDGTVFTGGEPIDTATTVFTSETADGARVSLSISRWSRWWQGAEVAILVTVVSVLAVAAGVSIAVWQARRISAPLVDLATSAGQLGAGQIRPQMASTGIAEIDQVATELARSSERLADRLEAERQFTTDARHQIRTPLTALSMRLEEIQMLTDDPEVVEEARIALDQVDRLVGVVDDLLAASRSVTGGNREPVEVADLTRQLGEEWAPTFARAGRKLIIDVPAGEKVMATPGQLSQIIATLIENSLRHGAGTTTVRLRQSGSRRSAPGIAVTKQDAEVGTGSGAMTAIEVTDEGPGVPDEIAGHIFERGFTTGGTGLGLALARNLAAADGGRLELAQHQPPVFALFVASVPKSTDTPQALTVGSTWTGGPG